MVIIPGLTQPLEAVGKQITTYNDSGKRLAVQACSVVGQALCPQCACSSSRIHGRCRRQIADCPCFGQPVTLDVEVRRFKCVNRHCPQRTFCERIDILAAPRQRRTLRLSKAALALGYALGGAAAARLGAHLGIHLSGTTVLRELRRAGCAPMVTSPTIIGIDDWAISRGHRYGTIVVDLERRCPIELLSGREVATVVPWLKAQSGVEVIARDRAGAYADAARTGAPAAQQVADRWHLLANMRDAIERLLVRCASQMKEAARQASKPLALAGEAAEAAVLPKTQDIEGVVPLPGGQRRSSERRALRMTRYEEVLRRHEAGQSVRAIGRTSTSAPTYGPSHERDHAQGLRHHHVLGDPSVIHEDASDFADHAFSSDKAPASASFLFMASSRSAEVRPPTEAFELPWRAPRAAPLRNPDPWRIERPPQPILA